MVHVAILGYGVVGSGVAELLYENSRIISQKAADEVAVKYILDVRDFPDSPFADKFVNDFSIIENDPDVKVVVETIGGAKAAFEFTKRALKAGKNVVTSNKELVAEHGYELLELAKENNLNYLFEASVGGGIPIIRPITQCLAANEIDEVCGILNGTTNYILTKMLRDGESFEAALGQAKQNGYAESDPTSDVEGLDACRKICILAALAYGHHVYPRQVPTQGITGITLADMYYARSGNMCIKLLGRAIRINSDKICVFVAPHLVPSSNLLSNVDDVFNGIMINGNAVGDAMFYGRGAGKMPTASAVVADIIDAIKHFKARKYVGWEEGGENRLFDPTLYASRWYLRAAITKEKVRRAFGDVIYLKLDGVTAGECAFLTQHFSEKELKERMADLEVFSFMRVLD
ncbi:MAG: homoserine dehydrogenase [Oscillospiraceae bacterium]|jgi:homoserine dehydrogenase